MESVILVEVMKVIAFLFLAHALEPGEQRAGKKGMWQEVSGRIGRCPRKCMVGMSLFLLRVSVAVCVEGKAKFKPLCLLVIKGNSAPA